MTARKRSEEAQKAQRQKVQEKVHQVLYCDADWNEHEVYGIRFKKIIERSNINEASIHMDEDVVREYKRRIERKLRGQETLDKSLAFYKILTVLDSQPRNQSTLISEMDDHSEECISQNLYYLEASGLIEKSNEEYKLSRSTKKLFLKTK